MALDLSQYRNLDPNNIGGWPAPAKGGVIAFVCAAVLGLGYWFDTQDQWAVLEQARLQEDQLKQDFEAKQAKAASLDAYRQQMVEMEESFGTMLRQLPSKTEVADLLVDITQTGLASNLEFELFKPGNGVPREFYAELPIEIRVVGVYHSFGEFVSGVAALPRIVTLHDISIVSSQKVSGSLTMQANAKTYRYLDEDEIAVARKAQEAERARQRR